MLFKIKKKKKKKFKKKKKKLLRTKPLPGESPSPNHIPPFKETTEHQAGLPVL